MKLSIRGFWARPEQVLDARHQRHARRRRVAVVEAVGQVGADLAVGEVLDTEHPPLRQHADHLARAR